MLIYCEAVLASNKDYRVSAGRFTSEDSVERVARKMPNDQEITAPLSLNKYTYGCNNPVLYTESSGHVAIPFIATVLLAGTVTGMLAAAVDSAFKKNFSIQKVAQSGAIGGMLTLPLGATAAYFGTGSALASTSAVGAGLGYGWEVLG